MWTAPNWTDRTKRTPNGSKNVNFSRQTEIAFQEVSVLFSVGCAGCCKNRCTGLWGGEPPHKSEVSLGKYTPFSEWRRNFRPKHCHTDCRDLTLTALCRMIVLAWNMLRMYIESLGHCGVAALRWPSLFSWLLEWCLKQDLCFVPCRSCKRQYYCRTNLWWWTDTILPAGCVYMKYP